MNDLNNKASPNEKVYLPFVPFYSLAGGDERAHVCHRLFDDTPEQLSYATAPWDNMGWSRDGWIM